MTTYVRQNTPVLHDATTGRVVGIVGRDGKEYTFPLITFPDAVNNYTDTSSVPGNATINTARGRVSVSAAATSVTVTNSLCSTTSYININVSTNDATCAIRNIVPGNGSFTANFVAATAQTNLDFVILS